MKGQSLLQSPIGGELAGQSLGGLFGGLLQGKPKLGRPACSFSVSVLAGRALLLKKDRKQMVPLFYPLYWRT